MLKVGIFTPYVRNEITLAATQLADWLTRCGIDVSMLSSGKIESGIHPEWDQKVRRAKKTAVYPWAYGATHLCWFDASVSTLKWTKLVESSNSRISTKNYYFPHWSRWSAACGHFSEQADRVICLNRDIFYWLHKLDIMDTGRLKEVGSWANLMTPNRVLIPKKGKANGDQTRLLALLPKAVSRDLGIGVLAVLDALLCDHPALRLTILIESTLPRSYRSKLKDMQQKHRGYLKLVSKLPYYHYSALAREHDWVYVANTRHLFGSLISTLTDSSVPLICHDLPPIGAHVGDKQNGVLIPCNLQDSVIPVADVDLRVVFEYLDRILDEPEITLRALQVTGNEQMVKRQGYFENFIYKEFV